MSCLLLLAELLLLQHVSGFEAMHKTELKFKIESCNLHELPPAARKRIEVFQNARRLDFGTYLANYISGIQKQKKQVITTK